MRLRPSRRHHKQNVCGTDKFVKTERFQIGAYLQNEIMFSHANAEFSSFAWGGNGDQIFLFRFLVIDEMKQVSSCKAF